MLETEEVDDDFFTPVAGTSLANIFVNVTKKESSENNSLKYVPPKPQNIAPIKKEQVKTTECVFACALVGHEWCNNVYTSRGKLGFAILKIQKSGDHSIVLYDASKTTLSTTTVTKQLAITVKNRSYISYYDNSQKYWSIYGTEDEIKNITEVLNKLDASVKYSTYDDRGPPEPFNSEFETNAPLKEIEPQMNKESDTDSSLNRKTKESILNRMANMGHSVLPTRVIQAERSSDSSDANEIEPTHKTIRHKPVKPGLKRNQIDNFVTEVEHPSDIQQRIITAKPELDRNINVYKSQLIPLPNTSVLASNSNDLTMFMSEQRISNSELRINMNRVTDKIDMVLSKLNNMGPTEGNTNASTAIMMKLLEEYENKLKVYEELLKGKGMDSKKIVEETLGKDSCLIIEETDILKKKISKTERERDEKNVEILNLQKQMKDLEEKLLQDNMSQVGKEKELLTRIDSLEVQLKVKDKELSEFKESNQDKDTDDIKDKVKNIMNNTFQTISNNFENQEAYNGETIKRIIGTVIKRITVQTLNEL